MESNVDYSTAEQIMTSTNELEGARARISTEMGVVQQYMPVSGSVLSDALNRPLIDWTRDELRFRLQSNDGEIVEVDGKVVRQSRVIRGMIEDLSSMPNPSSEPLDEPIPLPNVNGAILRKVVQWCTYHRDDEDNNLEGNDLSNTRRIPPIIPGIQANTLLAANIQVLNSYEDLVERHDLPANFDEMTAWDSEFLKVDQGTLFEIIVAANYLDIRSLLDCACMVVASMIRGKSAEEIRRTFNIRNDFSPQEEEQIKLENEWCDFHYPQMNNNNS